MEGNEETRGYASSPCMVQEFETFDDGLQLYYLYIEEQRGDFSWQLRAHEQTEPVEIGRETFRSEREAQDAGRRALDRFCAQVRRHGGPA